MRAGRYVVPLRADARGRIRGIVHDQSGSGATLFIEPLTTVDLNNEYRRLQLDEQDEVQRILAALSARDPQHAAGYRERGRLLRDDLEALHQRVQARLRDVQGYNALADRRLGDVQGAVASSSRTRRSSVAEITVTSTESVVATFETPRPTAAARSARVKASPTR